MKAARYLTYAGDIDDCLGVVMGPTLLGEYVTCVEQSYDLIAGSTRLGFAYGIDADAISERIERINRNG